MGENYNGASLADISALMNNGNNGWMNNPFMYLIWLAFFCGNGFGFGRNGQGLHDAEIMSRINGISQQIADNQNANSLAQGIAGNHDYLHAFSNSANMGFAGLQQSINNAIQSGLLNSKDLQAALQSCCCNNQTAILNQTNQLQGRIDQLANGITQGFASVGYAQSEQTNALTNVANANTQRILDKMCADTTQALRDKVAELSQAAQTAEIISKIPTTATT